MKAKNVVKEMAEKARQAQMAHVTKARKANKDWTTIAAELGVTRQRVHQIARAAGLKGD